jgi:hypothetical protein
MSDVLIKDMEIPKDYKYVDVRIFRDGTATISSAEEPFYKKMDVIELPPHGKLIDADAMNEKYGDWYTEEGTEEGFIGTLKYLIAEQPIIIEAEGT